MAILDLKGVSKSYGGNTVLHNIDLSIEEGEFVAIVGFSGSGKSTLINLIAGLAMPDAGEVLYRGKPVTGPGPERGLVFQSYSLMPWLSVKENVALAVDAVHTAKPSAERGVLTRRAVETVGLGHATDRRPKELSGGMRQRVLIAIALVAKPRLLVADEPTSALDVTVQRRILDHLDDLTSATGTGVLLITHDLGVAADRADRIVVMSRGRVVETGTPDEVLGAPREAYTRALLAAAPSLRGARRPDVGTAASTTSGPVGTAGTTGTPGTAAGDAAAAPARSVPGAAHPAPPAALEVRGLVKDFPLPRGAALRAVDDVSFAVPRGRTLALVGESGSGKSTTARLALRLAEPTAGTVHVDGVDVTRARGADLRALRRRLQVVQQNPYASLDPRWPVERIVTEPLRAFGVGTRRERAGRAAELLDVVALPSSALQRRPAELSGGQRQRVAIARALSVRPDIVVLDEPVSALDVSVQAQILDLLADLQRDLHVSYLFISHDLAVVRQVAHDVVVLRHGRVVEQGDVEQVLARPEHPYTAELLAAIPGASARAHATGGER